MGGFSAQVQQPQTSQASQSMGKGGGQSPIANSIVAPAVVQPQTSGGGKSMSQGRPDGLDQNAINADPTGFEQWQQQAARANVQPPNGGMPQGGYNGNSTPKPMGKGGVQTNSATSGQPRMGMQNQYSNTVGQWDNTQIQPQSHSGGKGKG